MSAKAQMAPARPPAPAMPTHSPAPVESIFNLQRAIFEAQEEGLREPAAQPEVLPVSTPVPLVPDLEREALRHLEVMRRDCPEPLLNAFRQLRARLLRRVAETTGVGRMQRTVFVTSPTLGAGKTFVARNLAVMTGVIPDCRVLLAEANPARPELTRLMGLEGAAGVRDSYADSQWEAISRRVPGLDVFIVGSGVAAVDAIDPFDARLMERFRQRIGDAVDWLILDGPSLNESAEAETLAHLADMTVVVVQPGSLNSHELGRCLSRLNRSKIAGVVFNRAR